MRIVFHDPNNADYHVGSVFDRPLGGTQSAACYLAMELAALGHSVSYLTGVAQPLMVRNVACLGQQYLRRPAIAGMNPDIFIVIQGAGGGPAIRAMLPPRARLLFWTADTPHQPVVQDLKNPLVVAAYDAVITVSDWQRLRFAEAFSISPEKLYTLRYGISPAFQALYPPGTPVMADKPWPPILAYTSTPFRGLNVLLRVFPEIRRRMPGSVLRVFSAMRVYFIEPSAESSEMRELYDRCRATEGVDYVGNLPQPQLAQQMRRVSMLCYPNTYEETACVAVMEAMAAGCLILTSDFGALPETCAGRARLIDPRIDVASTPAVPSTGLPGPKNGRPFFIDSQIREYLTKVSRSALTTNNRSTGFALFFPISR
jgi:glycosyltransferase involved in cell wall biosynthesis